MTRDELMIARNKYDYLVNMNEDMMCLKERFLEFCNNSIIQEYIVLNDYNNDCYKSIIMELETNDLIRKYLYLSKEYDGFRVRSDDELVSEAFSHLVGNVYKERGIYVFIGGYNKLDKDGVPAKISDYDLPMIELLNYKNLNEVNSRVINRVYKKIDGDELKYVICKTLNNIPKIEYELVGSSSDCWDYGLYRDLETMAYILVSKKNISEFETSNKIVNFKNSYHDSLTLFYNLRVQYLRQYLFDDKCKLFSDDKGLERKRKIDF